MAEPVALAEARRFLRVDADDDDALIGTLIVAARQFVEGYTGLVLTERDVVQVVPFGAWTDLAAWPITSLTIAYADDAGAQQPVTAWSGQIVGRPGRISIPRPAGASAGSQALVTVKAGYAVADVPDRVRVAILRVAKAIYEDRDGGADALTVTLLRDYRRRGI